MAGYNKTQYRKNNPRGVYVPPHRNFSAPEYAAAHSTYGPTRRVEIGFSGSTSNGGGRVYHNRSPSPRGGGHKGRYDPYRGGRGKKKGDRRKHRGAHDYRKDNRNERNESRWFKVQIPFGKKFGKDFILSSLTAISTVPFIPYNFQYESNAALFYIDNQEAERSLKGTNKRITTPTGIKMTVLVTSTPPPTLNLDGEAVEQMKICMSKRFDVDTCLLNLSNFHYDPDLKNSGLFLPLNRYRVFETITTIIKENVPQLEGLDLSNNRLQNLSPLVELKADCKALKSLNLKENSIRNAIDLDPLKGFNAIVELILDGNPICDQFKDQATYISAIRDRMPNVTKLDGLELPPPIVFDLGQAADVPKTKGSYFPSEDVKALVLHFLESFFSCYDSDNRQNLLSGYHDDAYFSLSVSKFPKQPVEKYSRKSRNILKPSRDNELKHTTLKQGKLNIVAALNDLPRTVHDPTSMTVDVAHASATLMTFTVMGVFKEGTELRNTSKPLLNFSRTFIVVPTSDQRILIINDMHYMGPATPPQMKVFESTTQSVPEVSSVPDAISVNSDEDKQSLVIQMVQASGMNMPYASRCLEENNWSLSQAIAVFNELKVQGVIPPEAF